MDNKARRETINNINVLHKHILQDEEVDWKLTAMLSYMTSLVEDLCFPSAYCMPPAAPQAKPGVLGPEAVKPRFNTGDFVRLIENAECADASLQGLVHKVGRQGPGGQLWLHGIHRSSYDARIFERVYITTVDPDAKPSPVQPDAVNRNTYREGDLVQLKSFYDDGRYKLMGGKVFKVVSLASDGSNFTLEGQGFKYYDATHFEHRANAAKEPEKQDAPAHTGIKGGDFVRLKKECWSNHPSSIAAGVMQVVGLSETGDHMELNGYYARLYKAEDFERVTIAVAK